MSVPHAFCSNLVVDTGRYVARKEAPVAQDAERLPSCVKRAGSSGAQAKRRGVCRRGRGGGQAGRHKPCCLRNRIYAPPLRELVSKIGCRRVLELQQAAFADLPGRAYWPLALRSYAPFAGRSLGPCATGAR